jgi:PAS domain S-box-containing protein
LPAAGSSASYRTRIAGAPARVDLSAAPGGRERPVSVLLSPHLDDDNTANRALLTLSREAAAARTDRELVAAVVHALEVLFPGRSFCIRLVDPKTFALTAIESHGRLRSRGSQGARGADRIALRRAAILRTGLSEEALRAGGVEIAERDEPILEGCQTARVVPLAAGGTLYGAVNLESRRGRSANAEADEPWLLHVANQAAQGLRNLRSIEELTFFKNYLEELIENANALIVVANRDREILVFNRAITRLTGFAREHALGEDLLSLVADVDRDQAMRVFSRSLAGEAVTNVEVRLALRSGGEARVSVNTAPVYGSSGAVEGFIAIGQDLTLLRAMEERAEHAQKLAGFGQLAAGIVHELNNPLTTITAYSDNLIERLSRAEHDPGDLEKLRRIRDAGQRILRFSRDLSAYARPSDAKTESVDLAGILDQAAQMCEPALRASGAKLERVFQPVPAIAGNKGSLLQVFVNLITNAAQALRGSGTVRLELEKSGGSVVARVRDDGCGMPDEVKARAFEPFFTTKPDGRGSGLGLSIVQGIVGRHAGGISVESQEGVGTTFIVTLPRRSKGPTALLRRAKGPIARPAPRN